MSSEGGGGPAPDSKSFKFCVLSILIPPSYEILSFNHSQPLLQKLQFSGSIHMYGNLPLFFCHCEGCCLIYCTSYQRLKAQTKLLGSSSLSHFISFHQPAGLPPCIINRLDKFYDPHPLCPLDQFKTVFVSSSVWFVLPPTDKIPRLAIEPGPLS